jgi:hypothetical protein
LVRPWHLSIIIWFHAGPGCAVVHSHWRKPCCAEGLAHTCMDYANSIRNCFTWALSLAFVALYHFVIIFSKSLPYMCCTGCNEIQVCGSPTSYTSIDLKRGSGLYFHRLVVSSNTTSQNRQLWFKTHSFWVRLSRTTIVGWKISSVASLTYRPNPTCRPTLKMIYPNLHLYYAKELLLCTYLMVCLLRWNCWWQGAIIWWVRIRV